MTEIGSTKRYDLEERTLKFAKDVIEFVNVVPKTLANTEIMKQVIRSSGSVGADCIGRKGQMMFLPFGFGILKLFRI